jgi:hypothetical protein
VCCDLAVEQRPDLPSKSPVLGVRYRMEPLELLTVDPDGVDRLMLWIGAA